ncbi:hypothetical protein SAMN04490240_0068 [Rhodococcus pyridinivorans]|nr:hypothetical protein SAMN04490240_0068 [Rhodococcus pyridinivorans]
MLFEIGDHLKQMRQVSVEGGFGQMTNGGEVTRAQRNCVGLCGQHGAIRSLAAIAVR